MDSSNPTFRKKVSFADEKALPLVTVIKSNEPTDPVPDPASNEAPLPPSIPKRPPSLPTGATTRKVILLALCTFVVVAGAAFLAYRISRGQSIRLNLNMVRRLV